MSTERDLGLAVEDSVQEALDGGAPMRLLSNLYMAAQVVVVPGAVLALQARAGDLPSAARHGARHVDARDPGRRAVPRRAAALADPAMVDTVSAQAPVQLSGRSTMFYNELAAVPSLHCGFALAVGIALAASARRRSTRLLALAGGPIVCLTVVATGNHYVFDIAAGLAVTAVGYGVGALVRRRRETVPQRTGLVEAYA